MQATDGTQEVKILIVSHYSILTMRSGMVKMCFNIARHLTNNGFKVEILTLKDPEHDEINYQGVTYHRGKTDFDVSKYDVVIAHPPYCDEFRTKAKGKFITLIDAVNHLNTVDDPVSYNNDLTIYTTNIINEKATKKGIIVHPPVFPEEHQTERGDKITIVGMSQHKGAFLAQNLSRLMKSHQFMGVVSGVGKDTQIKTRLSNFEIVDEVEDMREIWSKTKILIAPSISEQYGKASLEAMASGIPVIAYDQPGVREALGDAAIYMDNLILVKWKEELLRLLNDPEHYKKHNELALKQSKMVDSKKELDQLVDFLKATKRKKPFTTIKKPIKLGVIWIGDDSKRPDRLIQTWKDKHPNSEHVIYDNEYLKNRKWKNQSLIDEYLKVKDYPGVADIMRYEILLDEEVFIHPADSECLHPIYPLLENDIITVYENEKVRPGLISPVYYATPNHPFIDALVNNLPKTPYIDGKYTRPWQTTGNLYMQKTYESKYWGFRPLPSYTFTPMHYTGEEYKGKGKVYARQLWGSTFDIYGTKLK